MSQVKAEYIISSVFVQSANIILLALTYYDVSTLRDKANNIFCRHLTHTV